MQNSIPIQNIYLMLCYAWGYVRPGIPLPAGAEPFENIHSLLAALLARGTDELVRKGLGAGYAPRQAVMPALRGRVLVHPTVAGGQLARRRIVCEYDEYTVDTPCNQVLKACLAAMQGNQHLSKKARTELARLARYFAEVEDIRLRAELFSHLQVPKNETYRQLMSLCELLVRGLMVTEQGGRLRINATVRDEQMKYLYQTFLLQFYKYHLDKNRYRVHSPRLAWQLAAPPGDATRAVLPIMQTDIVVEDRLALTQLIIDAKFYPEALKPNQAGRPRLREQHLYQLHAYLANSTYPGRVSGMLLYPRVSATMRHTLPHTGGTMHACTVDLSADWAAVEAELLALVEIGQ